MAARYYGVDRGLEDKYVAEGSSTTSKGLEVVIGTVGTGADTWTRNDVLRALEAVKQHIIQQPSSALRD